MISKMAAIIWIIGSTLLLSMLAFLGIVTFVVRDDVMDRLLMFFVALSAGALMGGAFLHLIPEALESIDKNVFIFVLAGFILFFLVEKILHWRHCHKGNCKVHTLAYMSLIGGSVHNFIDGMIISAGYISGMHTGIITTLAVAFHKIPQEISNFGVMVYGGFGRVRALFVNFAVAVTAVLGGITGYLLSGLDEPIVSFIIPFAAGGFIYIAASDLIPEIRKESSLAGSMKSFIVFLIGLLLMQLLTYVR